MIDNKILEILRNEVKKSNNLIFNEESHKITYKSIDDKEYAYIDLTRDELVITLVPSIKYDECCYALSSIYNLSELVKSVSNTTPTPSMLEYASYREDPNTSEIIMDVISGTSGSVPTTLYYGDNQSIKTSIYYEINDDDLVVESTSNMIYVSIDLNRLDTKLELDIDKLSKEIPDLEDILSSVKIVSNKENKEVFKDIGNTYLIKIQIKTGKIYMYDTELNKFTDTGYNYDKMDMKSIAQDLLTPDYLDKYMGEILQTLKSDYTQGE